MVRRKRISIVAPFVVLEFVQTVSLKKDANFVKEGSRDNNFFLSINQAFHVFLSWLLRIAL